MRKIIGIASGGFTSEREISKKSGQVVFNCLLDGPYECYQIDLAKDQWTVEDTAGNTYSLQKGNFSFTIDGQEKQFDCIVNMIHGAPGENGQFAGYLEMLDIAHTSCPSEVAALTYNKRDCLAVAAAMGIPTANRYTLNQGETISLNAIEEKVGFPCFVKANRAGSSFGVYKVYDKNELQPAIEKAFKEDHQLLIETALQGKEITVGVLEWENEVKVLPITEIISENDFFDYQAKYEGKSTEITPAQLPSEWEANAKTMAKQLYSQMGLKGISRSEFIFQDGVPHLLEINTIPGMTLQSIIPQQAEAAGIPLLQLLSGVIETSLAKKA
jgi:D-alanine-D-alanine ligase